MWLCYCHAPVVMSSWLFLCRCPNKDNPGMPFCPKTSLGTLFLGTEQWQTIKNYGVWEGLSSLLPWAHMQCSSRLLLASVRAALRLRTGNATTCSESSLTLIWKVHVQSNIVPVCGLHNLPKRLVRYLVVNLCWAPCWLQCLHLFLRRSHAHAV